MWLQKLVPSWIWLFVSILKKLMTIFNVIVVCPAAASHQANATLSSCGAAKTQQGFILTKSSIASNRNSKCKFTIKGSDLSQCYAHCTVPAYSTCFSSRELQVVFWTNFVSRIFPSSIVFPSL